jgi:lipopolysaccharide transport system ATP-binding protein
MLFGLTRQDIQKKVDEIIDFSEIREFIDEPVVNYSTGMKARLGFSVAMSLNPDLILIDEVLGVGDVQFKRKSSEALKARIKSHMTAVIVSHSESTISDLCHRVVVIHKGETIFSGDTEKGLEIYRNL